MAGEKESATGALAGKERVSSSDSIANDVLPGRAALSSEVTSSTPSSRNNTSYFNSVPTNVRQVQEPVPHYSLPSNNSYAYGYQGFPGPFPEWNANNFFPSLEGIHYAQTPHLKPHCQQFGVGRGGYPMGTSSAIYNQGRGQFLRNMPTNSRSNTFLTDYTKMPVREKLNQRRHSVGLKEQIRGPRSERVKDPSIASDVQDSSSTASLPDQYNLPDFEINYEHAKFFLIKSYNEDDVHKSIKYSVWASTPGGNKKLDDVYRQADITLKEKKTKCPIFLFFSVNTSGRFLGVAEMTGQVDFQQSMEFWQEERWTGFFPLKWHIVKDVPNINFKSIVLPNNDNKPVFFSRDTQEIPLHQGLEMLKIFKNYDADTSLLDDFSFYDTRETSLSAQRSSIPSLVRPEGQIEREHDHLGSLAEDFKQMQFRETHD